MNCPRDLNGPGHNRSGHAILFDTSHPALTRRNFVTRPDVELNVTEARCAMLTSLFEPEPGMTNRSTTIQSTAAIRRRGFSAIATLAAALTALTVAPSADAAASRASPAHPTAATAARDAGAPIMAIVSIKSPQVTIYDADGWILRAPVSTGIKG